MRDFSAADTTAPGRFKEFSAGLSVALIAIPGNLAFGLMAFAPLGPDYRGIALAAGMLAAIIPALFLTLFGRSRIMITGPEAPPALALAAGLSTVAATAPPETLPTLAALTVTAAGLLQTLFGLFRLGGMVRFISYPVLVGLINGSALLILADQLPTLLGIADCSLFDLPGLVSRLDPAVLAVAMITVGIGLFPPRLPWRLPGYILGGLSGIAATVALRLAGVELTVFADLGDPHWAMPDPDLLQRGLTSLLSLPGEGLTLAATAATMAVLHAVKTVLCGAHARGLTGERPAPNRDLAVLGLGNMAGGMLGGLSANGMLARTGAAVQSGGRGKIAQTGYVIGGLLLLGLGAPLIGAVPQTVVTGVIIVIALRFFDPWLLRQARSVFGSDRLARRDGVINCAVVLSVMTVLLIGDLIVALGVGLIASGVEFISRQSRSPIKAVHRGSGMTSSTMRYRADEEALAPHLDRIRVIELRGPLFFAATESLVEDLERMALERVDFLLLDFRRVSGIDATAARMLTQQNTKLAARGMRVGVSYVGERDRHWHMLNDSGFFDAGLLEARRDLFDDTQSAFQRYTDLLLGELRPFNRHDGIALTEILERNGFDQEEAGWLDRYFTRVEATEEDIILHQGDPGDALFVMEAGAAEVRLSTEDHGTKRLARIAAGAIFGEMSLLDHQPRSADIVATTQTRLRRLTAANFERLRREHPDIAIKLVTQIALTLSERLRQSNSLIAELDR